MASFGAKNCLSICGTGVAHVSAHGHRSTVFVLVVAASLWISCTKSTEQQSTHHSAAAADWKFTLLPGNPIEGERLFLELECYKCHEIKGATFPTRGESDKGIGPELSQMAGMHPVELFAESIVNPNAVIDAEDKDKGFLGPDGRSVMPTYSDVLTIKQVADLAAYLNSLGEPDKTKHPH
jgi:mono/diheme cytochrome c family protein